MRWYERLYVGEKAKKHRFSILQAVRKGKKTGYYVLTLPSNNKNLLDFYPAQSFVQPYYKKQDILIVGVAADYEDAALLAGRILNEVYHKTGNYDVAAFVRTKPD